MDAALAADIALADSSIGWFEVVIVVNNDIPDANSVVVHIDNVQINEPVKTLSIGNFETGLDTWSPSWGCHSRPVNHRCNRRLACIAMIDHAAGGWQAGCLLQCKALSHHVWLSPARSSQWM